MGKFFDGLCFLKHLDRKNRTTLVQIVFEFSAELVELGGAATSTMGPRSRRGYGESSVSRLRLKTKK